MPEHDLPLGGSQTHFAGRVVGVVISTKQRDEDQKGYVWLRGPDGEDYFSHISGWHDSKAFKSAAETQPVSFKVSMTPSGKRAWDVRAPNAEEQAAVDTMADQTAAARANQVRNEELAEQSSKGRRLRTNRPEVD